MLKETGKRLVEQRISVVDVDEIGRNVDATQFAIDGLLGYAEEKEGKRLSNESIQD